MSDARKRAAVAREALSLAIGTLDIGNLAKAIEWSAIASQLGHPQAETLHAACVRLQTAFDAVNASPRPSGREADDDLALAADAAASLMVTIAEDLGEELHCTKQGFADGQLLRAVHIAFARHAINSNTRHP